MDEQPVNSAETLYDVFLSYSHQDLPFVQNLVSCLDSLGIACWTAYRNVGSGSYYSQIVAAIRASRVFIPVITKHSAESTHCMHELDLAVNLATDRSKLIIPLVLDPEAIKESNSLRFYLLPYHWLTGDGTDYAAIRSLACQIESYLRDQNEEALLFRKLAAFRKSGLDAQTVETICKLIPICCRHAAAADPNLRNEYLRKLIQLMEHLHQLYDYDYSQAGQDLARTKLTAIDLVSTMVRKWAPDTDDLFLLSAIIRLIYFDRQVRLDCADSITGGMVSDGFIKTLPEEDYIKCQKPYVEQYRILLAEDRYPKSQEAFILSAADFIYKKDVWNEIRNPVARGKSSDDELLHAVASFIRESNNLLGLIGEKHMGRDYMKCLITCYERLKAYCVAVGEQEICAECIDRLEELKARIDRIGTGGNTLPKADDGIKSLLGLKLPHSGKYDVFISHKKEDYDIALDMYDFLTGNLLNPFLDRKSLPEMAEAQYRKSIMKALDGSTHFVVIISDLSYLQSYWVALEMSIFQSELDEGRKKGSNFIMVVTDDVYEKIMGSNKTALDIEYRRCEVMRVSEYKRSLMNYLGK